MQSQATYNYKVVRQCAVVTVIWGGLRQQIKLGQLRAQGGAVRMGLDERLHLGDRIRPFA